MIPVSRGWTLLTVFCLRNIPLVYVISRLLAFRPSASYTRWVTPCHSACVDKFSMMSHTSLPSVPFGRNFFSISELKNVSQSLNSKTFIYALLFHWYMIGNPLSSLLFLLLAVEEDDLFIQCLYFPWHETIRSIWILSLGIEQYKLFCVSRRTVNIHRPTFTKEKLSILA